MSVRAGEKLQSGETYHFIPTATQGVPTKRENMVIPLSITDNSGKVANINFPLFA